MGTQRMSITCTTVMLGGQQSASQHGKNGLRSSWGMLCQRKTILKWKWGCVLSTIQFSPGSSVPTSRNLTPNIWDFQSTHPQICVTLPASPPGDGTGTVFKAAGRKKKPTQNNISFSWLRALYLWNTSSPSSSSSS